LLEKVENAGCVRKSDPIVLLDRGAVPLRALLHPNRANQERSEGAVRPGLTRSVVDHHQEDQVRRGRIVAYCSLELGLRLKWSRFGSATADRKRHEGESQKGREYTRTAA